MFLPEAVTFESHFCDRSKLGSDLNGPLTNRGLSALKPRSHISNQLIVRTWLS
jgi:hypothetical protein